MLAESYYLSFGTPVVTLRPFNTFGPRQSARAVIPAIIIQLAAGSRRLKLGARWIRPGTSPTSATPPGRSSTWARRRRRPSSASCSTPAPAGMSRIGQLAAEIAGLMGVDAEISEDPGRLRPKDSEVMRLCCDATRLRERTGWQPGHTREQGLQQTIEWFQRPGILARYNPGEYSQ